ncbi:MAG TPA: hypothetical protein VEZ44_09995 [bacterium]|nr:hypothetical protein [bacterium]
MTIDEFWGALIRSWRLGAAVLIVCTAVGVVAGVLTRPSYEATAVFQVEQLADIGGSVSWDTPHSVRPRLNVDVLEKWLGGADVLDRVVALAGAQGQVTPAALHRDLLVIPAGDVGLYEVTARNASPDLARRIADAAAVVLADRAARFVALEQNATLTRLRRALAETNAVLAGPAATAASPADGTAPAQVRRQAALDAAKTLEQQIVLLEANQKGSPPTATIVQKAERPVAPVTAGRLLYAWFGATSGFVLAIAVVLIRDGLRRAATV